MSDDSEGVEEERQKRRSVTDDLSDEDYRSSEDDEDDQDGKLCSYAWVYTYIFYVALGSNLVLS